LKNIRNQPEANQKYTIIRRSYSGSEAKVLSVSNVLLKNIKISKKVLEAGTTPPTSTRPLAVKIASLTFHFQRNRTGTWQGALGRQG